MPSDDGLWLEDFHCVQHLGSHTRKLSATTQISGRGGNATRWKTVAVNKEARAIRFDVLHGKSQQFCMVRMVVFIQQRRGSWEVAGSFDWITPAY
jgi:hypothetical protein